MRTIMEEQGLLIVSSIIGISVVTAGMELFSTLSPMIELYLLSMM